MDYTPLLKNVPLFDSLSDADCADLVRMTRVKKYRKNDTIIHEDDPGSILYIIVSGQVKITTNSQEGGEAILAILTDGEFFGELSLLDQEPRSANVVAMIETQIMVLHRHDFLKFLYRHPGLVAGLLAALSRRLRKADKALQDAIFLKLPARLAKCLLDIAKKHGTKTDRGIEIGLRLTQQDLADMIGASRVAVNKQLNTFKTEGLIDIDRHRLIIIQPEELEEYTCSFE